MPEYDFDVDEKYYRVTTDNFLWRKGAILVYDDGNEGYMPIDGVEIWNTTKFNGGEYISARIVENAPLWFERVYPVKRKEEVKLVNAEEAEKEYTPSFEPIRLG